MKPLTQLRMVATTAFAITTGVARAVLSWGTGNRGIAALNELQPGDMAPDFALEASDGCTYTLSQFAGQRVVVLAWFPKAFTGGCTSECQSIGTSSSDLRQFDVVHFGASVDRPETNRRFAASMGIDYPILSDPHRTAARAYGVLGASGFPSRRTFFIGLDGRVLSIDRHVRTSTHGSDIVAALMHLEIPRQA